MVKREIIQYLHVLRFHVSIEDAGPAHFNPARCARRLMAARASSDRIQDGRVQGRLTVAGDHGFAVQPPRAAIILGDLPAGLFDQEPAGAASHGFSRGCQKPSTIPAATQASSSAAEP